MKRVIFQFATLNNQRVIRQITIQAPMVLAMEPGQSSCGDVFLSYKPPICKIFPATFDDTGWSSIVERIKHVALISNVRM